MANFYVRSGAAGSADGSSWANAFTSIEAALSGRTNADTLWVANDHSVDKASAITWSCPSSPGLRILGVNTNSTEPPTALNSTPAAIEGIAGIHNFNINGHAFIAAIKMRMGTTGDGILWMFNNSLNGKQSYDNCAFEWRAASQYTELFIASGNGIPTAQEVVLRGCTFKLSHANWEIYAAARIRFVECSFDSAGSTPTTLLNTYNAGGTPADIVFEACDLSGEAWSNIVNAAWPSWANVLVRDCKLPSSISLSTGTFTGPGGVRVQVHNSDSADTNYNFAESQYEGTVVDETTLVRTGGGAQSHRMDSSANVTFPETPLTVEGTIRNTSTGSAKTLTVEILHDSVTNLKNNEIWVEVIHLGTSGVPQGVLDIDDRVADVFATAADQASSAVTWTTTGMSNPNKQKLECTFTPQEAGYVRFKVCLAKASKTLYVDMLGASIA